jgi:hypothetical protein
VRTTIAIEDDLFYAVKERARRERRSAGDVVSDLLRQALTRVDDGEASVGSANGLDERLRARGIRPLPHRGGVVTNDLVNQLREDLDL